MIPSSLITVAIPYYQHAGFLRLAIESVLSQTVLPAEIILCDDSPSGEGAQMQALWPGHIRYVKNPARLGIGANWNQCLDLVTTPYAVVLSADDILLPDYIGHMLEVLTAHPEATAAFCEARTINETGARAFSLIDAMKRFLWPYGAQRLQPISGDHGVASLMRGDYIICPSMCYAMDKLAGQRFDTSLRMVLDLELFTRLLLQGHTLIGLRETLFAYRRHSGNYTKELEKDLARFKEEVACRHAVATHAASLGWTASERAARKATQVKLHYAYHALRLAVCGQWRAASYALTQYARIFRG